MTEPTPSKGAEHAAKFAQCCRNFRLVAEKVANIEPDFFSSTDVAKSLLAVTVDMLLPACGAGGAADFLRTIATQLDDGEWTPPAH